MLLVRILVVVGALLTILSLLAGYVRFQALDTGTVKDTAGELIADPEIRDEAAATLVDQLYANVDVEAALTERLPADEKGLAAPSSGALGAHDRDDTPKPAQDPRGRHRRGLDGER